MIDLIQFREIVESIWSIETTYCPDKWTTKNRAIGQCAVTTELLDKLCNHKGWRKKGKVNGDMHYWYNLDGMDIDLTWRQFPEGSKLTDVYGATKYHLVDNQWMQDRCDLLEMLYYRKLEL